MRKLLLALALFASQAQALPFHDGGSYTMTLYPAEKCQIEPLMAAVKPEFKDVLRRADVMHQGHLVMACYVKMDGHIVGVDESGTQFAIPESDFRDTAI